MPSFPGFSVLFRVFHGPLSGRITDPSLKFRCRVLAYFKYSSCTSHTKHKEIAMAEKQPQKAEDLSIWPDARQMIEKARRDNVETVWDRLAEQRPGCTFCEQGLSCSKCVMGPCRITPGKGKRERGVCGADADLTVARNFGRFVAAGAASHSDHGRDLVETLLAIGQGKTSDYTIRDPEKLRRIAAEVGVAVQDKSDKEIALALAEAFIEDFGFATPSVSFVARVPEKRRELWKKLGITPRGIDRDVVEMMHRTHMGVDSDAVSLCLHAARVSLTDGWGGSMIATELSDIIFGTPTPRMAKVNLGVLKADQVNVVVHGHSPIVSEMILAAARDPEMIRKAQDAGASGINVAGLCCTGNEVLMRQGIPMAGNHLMTELALVTGAVDCIVVDYQCIMPSLVTIAGCYQTRFISTSDKAKFSGAEHVEFNYVNARQKAAQVVEAAIDAFTRRDPGRVEIPGEPVELMTGFSNEAILGADQARHPRAGHRLRHRGHGQGRADGARGRGQGRGRIEGRMPVPGHSSGAARGQLRGQLADHPSLRRAGQCSGRGHQRPARGGQRPGMVFGKGRGHRPVRRGQRDLHPSGPAAAYHRQRDRDQSGIERSGRRGRGLLRRGGRPEQGGGGH